MVFYKLLGNRLVDIARMNSALAHETHRGGLVVRLNISEESILMDFTYQPGISIPGILWKTG
jgi:hypothetical protein